MSDDSTGPQKDLAMAPIARQENYNYAQNLLNVDGYLTHKTSVKEQQSDLQSIFLCQLQHLKNSRNKWISSNVNKSNVYCIDQPLHFSSSSDVNFTEVSYEKSPSMQSAQSHDAANYSVLSATEDVVYKVQYKTCSRYHVRSPYFSSRFPQDGDFVIVEGDRGVDLGMVVGVVSLDQYYRLVHLGGSSLGKIEEGKILRLATIRETQQMPLKSRGEENVARYCEELANNVYKLPMKVVETEFQFDRNKLTIMYVAEHRIDFRELVRDMYGRLKTRISMKQIFPDKKKSIN